MFDSAQIEIVEEEEGYANSYCLNVHYKKQSIAKARYYVDSQSYHLKWIETTERYQNKGVASRLLNFLCEKAIQHDASLIISVINSAVINSFYFKWFKKRVGGEESQNDEIVIKFNELVNEEDVFPLIHLEPCDLVWRPEERSHRIQKCACR